MKAKELLKPRYEVIAEYPKCQFKTGEILSRIKFATNDCYHTDLFAPVGGHLLSELEMFPHLFRKMDWWEFRSVENMPSKIMRVFDKRVYNVNRWNMKELKGYTTDYGALVEFTSLLDFYYIPID